MCICRFNRRTGRPGRLRSWHPLQPQGQPAQQHPEQSPLPDPSPHQHQQREQEQAQSAQLQLLREALPPGRAPLEEVPRESPPPVFELPVAPCDAPQAADPDPAERPRAVAAAVAADRQAGLRAQAALEHRSMPSGFAKSLRGATFEAAPISAASPGARMAAESAQGTANAESRQQSASLTAAAKLRRRYARAAASWRQGMVSTAQVCRSRLRLVSTRCPCLQPCMIGSASCSSIVLLTLTFFIGDAGGNAAVDLPYHVECGHARCSHPSAPRPIERSGGRSGWRWRGRRSHAGPGGCRGPGCCPLPAAPPPRSRARSHK